MDVERAFKLYDVRGKYPAEVDERMAYAIGRSLAGWKTPKKVLVSCDVRHSSPSLKKYLIDGFSVDEIEVSDLSEVPVPQFYWTMANDGYDLGVMITASHIDDSENGFKLVGKGGIPFDQAEVLFLKKLVEKRHSDAIVVPRREAVEIRSNDRYAAALVNATGNLNFSGHIVIDMTRSAVAEIVPGLFHRLKLNYSMVKSDHQGNPMISENRRDLVRMVLEKEAKLGIIWDSDGDRVAFIDHKGKFIPMSFVFGLLAQQEILAGRGKKVAVDVRAGLVVRDLVKEVGGELLVMPTWGQTFKFAMEEDPEICFAGEVSGHFIFKDFYGIDDGILAALKFLKKYDERIAYSVERIEKKYFELPEKNFDCPIEKSTVVLSRLTDYYRSRENLVSIVDGLTVFGESWKFNLRQSLTEPYLRLNLEARSQKEANEIIKNIENILWKN